MNKHALLISAVATLAGVGLLRLYMQRFEEDVRGGPATRVLIMLKDSPVGTELSRELLGTREVPQAYLESRHVPARDLERVLETRLGVAARANEALLFTDLATMREPIRQLSNLIPEGQRGFTLQNSSALDQLLAPGDRVDVLLLRNDRLAKDDETREAALVGQNLLVLAIGKNLGTTSSNGDERVSRSGNITLGVSVAQSTRLAEAELRGALRLVLRNPEDIALIDQGHQEE